MINPKPTIAVVTDSTCDLSSDEADKHGITVVPLNVHFGDTVYLDQVDITTDEFMDKMAASSTLPTTSQPSVGSFEDAFRNLQQRGFSEILCVTISSKLSGTFQSASIAAQNLAQDIRVEVVDSFSASYGLGLTAIRAKELVDSGASLSEIAETLRNEINRYQVVFFVETLEHLRRGGRIGKAAQMVGTVLQLKPLLRVDEGQIVPFERTRTRRKAIMALEQYVHDIGNVDSIAVLYNTTPGDAEVLVASLSQVTPESKPAMAKVSPVLATHIGPGVLGVVVKESLSE